MIGTLIEGLTIERYFALGGESSTGLKDMLVSPLAYKQRRDNGRPDRDTLRLGRACHTAILEPHRFREEYAVWDGGVRRGKDWEAFRIENAARTILTEAQVETALRVGESVRAHPVAGPILREPGKAEVTITWRHERTGLPCRARIDWLCSALVDLKTCREINPSMFGSQAARLGHHLQMALYSAALASVGVHLPVKLIAAQNQEPFDCAVYAVPDEVLVIGEQLYEAALDKVAACQRTGAWPGVAWDAELVLKLPAWAVTNALEEGDGSSEWSVAIAAE